MDGKKGKVTNDRDTISIFVALVSITIAILCFFITYPFADYSFIFLKCSALSLFIIFFPQALNTLANKFKNNTKITKFLRNNNSFKSFIALSILTISGFIGRFVNINFLLYFFSIIGIYLFLVTLFTFFKKSNLIIFLRFTAISIFIGGWFGSTFLSSNIQKNCGKICNIYPNFTVQGMWHNPLLKQWLLIQKAPFDSSIFDDLYFHSSILNMIKTYGVAGFGLDGIDFHNPLHYHYGSHWIFAQLSNLLNLDGLEFFQFAFPIIFIPFLLQNILMFSIDLRECQFIKSNHELKSDLLFWFIFIVAFVNIIPWNLLQEMIPWWNRVARSIHSDSYSLSISLSLILLSTILRFFQTLDFKDNNILNEIIVFTYFPFMLGLISFIKISTGFLLFGVAIYFFLRFKLYRYNMYRVLLLLFVLVFLFVYQQVSGGEATSGMRIELFSYLKYSVGKNWGFYFYFFHVFWSWIYILLRLVEKKIYSLKRLLNEYISLEILDVEFIFILTLFSVGPGLIIWLPGGNNFYFSDFQTLISLSFVLANLPNFLNVFKRLFL